MATKKITDLTELSSADAASADVLPIVDIDADVTKKITLTGLKSGSFSGSFSGDGSGLTGVVSASYAVSSSHEIIKEVSSSFADLAAGLTLTPSISVTNITASGGISSSGIITADTGSFSHLKGNSPITIGSEVDFKQGITGSNMTLSGSLDVVDPFGTGGIKFSGSILHLTGSVKTTGSFTTSGSFVIQGGNLTLGGGIISGSGDINANTGSFSYLKGNSDINIVAGDRIIFQSGSLIVSGSHSGDSVAIFTDTGVEVQNDVDQFKIRAKLEDGEGSVSYVTNFLVKNRELNKTLIQCGQTGQSTDLQFPGVGSKIIMPITPTPTSETISGSLVPVGDNNWDIGSSLRGWKNAYFNTASIDVIESSTVFTQAITASSVISASGGKSYFKSLDVGNGSITNVGGIECDQLLFAEDTTNIFNLTATNFGFDLGEVRYVTINSQGLNVVGAITASAGISGTIETAAQAQITTLAGATSIGQNLQTTNFPGIVTITQGVTVEGSGIHYDGIVSSSATDAAFYSNNNYRGEVRSQLQGGVAADTGWRLELHNDKIVANSIILTNVIGGAGAIITGSVVTTNVVSAKTASMNFFNTGIAIPDDSPFTASFAVF
jgi:TATA-box binding protein (TBP) (component of TFIID and TFIIIB)